MTEPQTIYIALQDFSHLGRRYRSGETVDTARMRPDVVTGLTTNGRMAATTPSPVPDTPPEQPDPEGPPTEPATEKPARKPKPDAG